MGTLETREMEYFVAVAEHLHFGKAAEHLGTAQPALSRAVARIERRLGVRLFNRTTRHVTLTPAGAALLAECRAILVSIEGAVRRVRRAALPRRLALAVRPGTGQGPLADILSTYRRRPDATPFDLVLTYTQETALRDGTADVALTCQTAPLAPDLDRIEVGTEEPVALLPADHALAARSSLITADLLALDNFAAPLPLESTESIVDRVALGDFVVIAGHTVRRRLGPSVTAVPVTDSPRARLHLAWLPEVANPARDELLGTASRVLMASDHFPEHASEH